MLDPTGKAEPRLVELLDDPVARALMARDGVRPEDVIALVHGVRETRWMEIPAADGPGGVS